MNLFARDFTNRSIFGFEIGAGMLQSVNPLFIILFAPVFGWLWGAMGQWNPSQPIKIVMGLTLLKNSPTKCLS